MQQLWALFLREFRSYFRSFLAFMVFFVYLFVSIGSSFYFGSYLGMHDTALYALFYAQPIILAVLIPALSMRLWSEEYRLGTIEFLLTQPIKIMYLVLAKYLALLLFCLLMTIFLLPFVFYSSGWLKIDWQNIVSDYVGLGLSLAALCAVGSFISSLSRSMIVSYLTGFLFSALLVVIPCFKFYEIYNNFLFAEIGVSDVVYFIAIAFSFILLNIEAIKLWQKVKRLKFIKFSVFTALVWLGTGLFYFTFDNFFAEKADFTTAKLYTPKTETKEILQKINKSVSIDIYAAKDYVNSNADYFHYSQQIKRFLTNYTKLSQGMVEVNINYVEPYSELEEAILEKGLYFETNNKGSRDYFGAVIHLEDGQEQIIKQFLLQRRQFVEKDVDIALLKLFEPERIKTIGVYIDNTQNLDGLQAFLLGVENDYNVFNVSPLMYDFSNTVDMIILLNPKQISSTLRYGLDQFVLRGGKLISFIDFYTESQTDLVNQENVQFVDFLNKWKINLKDEMVDNGKMDSSFGRSLWNLHMNKAVVFNNDNEMLSVKPFIKAADGLIGAIFEGKFFSLYSKNPYENTEIYSSMKPFLPMSLKDGQVAVVGDVDMLEETFWLAASSPDRNPYSVIETSGNEMAVKSLIDYMAGNEIYEKLPLNDKLLNRESISQKIKAQIFNKIEAKYKALQNKITEQRSLLFVGSGQDMSKFELLLQISDAGQKLAQDEKKLQTYEYEMKQQYSHKITNIMLVQILALPLLLLLVASIALRWLRRVKNIKLEKKYHV